MSRTAAITSSIISSLLMLFIGWDVASSQEHPSTIQHLEGILHAAQSIKDHSRAVSGDDAAATQGGKCGLWVSFEAARHWDEFTPFQKKQLQGFLSPDQTQSDTVIGHFHIFYDTTGFNTPALLDDNQNRIPNTSRAYVDSVGRVFNEVWSYEIDHLGYDAPPFKGGQSSYNIYVKELGSRLYGQTVFSDSDRIAGSYPPRYTSYIEIDNDYEGFYSPGMAGLKVTAAHEFHHAIQVGSYGYWSNEQYIYEITSTWLEDVVYHGVNDYLQYLQSPFDPPQRGQFLSPDRAFTSMDDLLPYSRAIWGKFVAKRYSRDAMRWMWENMRQENSLPAIDHALNRTNSSFRTAFLEWANWNAHTGPYCDTVNYYTEGRLFPEMYLKPRVNYTGPPRSFLDTVDAVSSTYHPVCIRYSDSASCITQMLVIVSNLNVDAAYNSQRYGFTYDMSNTDDGTFKILSNGIFVRLAVPDPSNWASQEDVPSIVADVVVFPNPFSPREQKPVNFRLPSVIKPTATLYVFNSNMDKIVSEDVDVIAPTSEPRIQWDGHDGRGNLIGTGVYFYVITVDDKQYTGKFAVVKE